MSRDPQSLPRASDVAREFLRQAMRGGLPLCKFAARLVDAYHVRVPVCDRETEFHSGTTTDALIRAEKANGKLVTRILDGTVKFPLDLLEAWCEALPSPLALDCRRTLARRLGFVGVLPPAEVGPAADVGALAAEFGETMRELAPLLVDGGIDSRDCPSHIRAALRQGTDLMAAWLSLQQQLVAALDGQSGPRSGGASE